jgi:hypothetical protein
MIPTRWPSPSSARPGRRVTPPRSSPTRVRTTPGARGGSGSSHPSVLPTRRPAGPGNRGPAWTSTSASTASPARRRSAPATRRRDRAPRGLLRHDRHGEKAQRRPSLRVRHRRTVRGTASAAQRQRAWRHRGLAGVRCRGVMATSARAAARRHPAPGRQRPAVGGSGPTGDPERRRGSPPRGRLAAPDRQLATAAVRVAFATT